MDTPLATPGRSRLAGWRAAFGREARDVPSLYAHLLDGDPLDLLSLCARRVRDQAYLLDVDRICEQTAARIAMHARLAPSEPDPAWLLDHVDFTIDAALAEDMEKERTAIPDPEDPHYAFLTDAFAIPPALARSAAVAFNGLDPITRKRTLLLLDKEPIDSLVQQGWGPREELAESFREGLDALQYLTETPPKRRRNSE